MILLLTAALEAVALFVLIVAGVLVAEFVRPWLHRAVAKPVPPPAPVQIEGAELNAVRQAYEAMGLPREQFDPSVNLVPTGKLYEILYHASAALGKDHELRTVQDVVDWLREAPRKEPT